MAIEGWSVVWTGDRIQAEQVMASLEADGLTVEIFGDTAYGVGVNFTEARLMVPNDQVDAARKLITEAEAQPPAEDV